ncbi:extracellular solute-binding protein [Candidatus Epulonipiscium viviparus]|uniref:extracellular solute-binding protein n=2 Tax=Candidatus Epulonipiscium viviparus TaxID=420336 RepID=UPI0027380C5F|nr:extracellular solute-binding protein [Candidatus Epulopiscium viviparus]
MKMIKTTMAIAIMASLAGCGNSDDTTTLNLEKTLDPETGRMMIDNMFVEGLPIVKEPKTFTMFVAPSGNDKSTSQDEKHILPILQENTNVHFELQPVSTNANEKLNLLFAAGTDLPDIIFSWPPESTVINNTAHLFEFTDEILREYAPNLTSQIEANLPDGLDTLRKSDGKIYSLPVGVYAEYANSAKSIPLIRQDWLDAVNMEMPTNTDELYDVLMAFKTQDPNGNGKADEIPISFCQANGQHKHFYFAGPWGIAGRTGADPDNYFQVQNGIVKPNLDTQNFKDYLLYMHKLAQDGLFDVEGFSLTYSQYKSRVNEGVVGMIVTWMEDPAIWSPVPVLSAPGYEGQELKVGEKGHRTANMNGFMITKACDDPLAALRAWDYLHSDPNLKRIMRDGNEGLLWVENDDGSATVKEISTAELPSGINTKTELNYTIAFRGQGPVMFGDEVAKPDMNAEVLSYDALRYKYVPMYEEYFPTEFLPLRPMPSDKLTQLALLQTEIEAYMDGFIANSIINGLTDPQWKTHLTQLENVMYYDWIQLQQDYLDGKF